MSPASYFWHQSLTFSCLLPFSSHTKTLLWLSLPDTLLFHIKALDIKATRTLPADTTSCVQFTNLHRKDSFAFALPPKQPLHNPPPTWAKFL